MGGRTELGCLAKTQRVFDSRWHRENPQVYVLVVWFLKYYISLEGFMLLTRGDAGKRSGNPQIMGSPCSSQLALASGEAEHEPASPSNFNSKSMTQFL